MLRWAHGKSCIPHTVFDLATSSQPGQSFSFVAKNVKGQKVIGKEDSESLRPLGLNY
jgi:hypothetical protein